MIVAGIIRRRRCCRGIRGYGAFLFHARNFVTIDRAKDSREGVPSWNAGASSREGIAVAGDGVCGG